MTLGAILLYAAVGVVYLAYLLLVIETTVRGWSA
jgi:hypothetical protein